MFLAVDASEDKHREKYIPPVVWVGLGCRRKRLCVEENLGRVWKKGIGVAGGERREGALARDGRSKTRQIAKQGRGSFRSGGEVLQDIHRVKVRTVFLVLDIGSCLTSLMLEPHPDIVVITMHVLLMTIICAFGAIVVGTGWASTNIYRPAYLRRAYPVTSRSKASVLANRFADSALCR